MVIFSFLPHLPFSPFPSFYMVIDLSSFYPPLYFWCWYLLSHCLFRACTGPDHNVPTSFNKACPNTCDQASSHHLPGFSNPFRHSGEVELNSCKQAPFKEEDLCWFNPIVQLWRQSQPSFNGCLQKIWVSNGQTWDKLDWLHKLYPERRETNNLYELNNS